MRAGKIRQKMLQLWAARQLGAPPRLPPRASRLAPPVAQLEEEDLANLILYQQCDVDTICPAGEECACLYLGMLVCCEVDDA